MTFRSDPTFRRRPCSGCGGIGQRSLRLCGQDVRHDQCLGCGKRHVDRTPLVPAPFGDCFADPGVMSRHDCEIVKSLVQLMTGNGLRVGVVETTARPFHDLRGEYGIPSATLRGFELPVFTWLLEQAPTHTLHFVVIDQGDLRICFRVRRRLQRGPR